MWALGSGILIILPASSKGTRLDLSSGPLNNWRRGRLFLEIRFPFESSALRIWTGGFPSPLSIRPHRLVSPLRPWSLFPVTQQELQVLLVENVPTRCKGDFVILSVAATEPTCAGLCPIQAFACQALYQLQDRFHQWPGRCFAPISVGEAPCVTESKLE